MLDDLHWADAASLELLGALLRRPPPAPVLLALAVRPRQVPERLLPALERAHRAGRSPASSSARSAARTREALHGDAAGTGLRGERRQPVLPAAARPRARRAPGRRCRATSTAVALRSARSSRCSARRRARLLAGRGGRGRPVRPRARRGRRRRRRARGARRARRAAARGPGAPDRRPAPLPLPPPARAPRGLRRRARPAGGSARTSARRRRWRRAGASAAARAHHVEHSARHGDLDAVAALREAGARRRPGARRRAPRAGSRRALRLRRRRRAACRAARRAAARPLRATRWRADRRGSRDSRDDAARGARGSRRRSFPLRGRHDQRRARRSSGCSAATTRRARALDRALDALPDRGVAGGRRR